MGSACATVEDAAQRQPMRRQSFSSIKRVPGSQALLKGQSEFEEGYELGDQVGTDEAVLLAVNKDNDVEYVTRAIDKGDMLITELSQVDTYFSLLAQVDHTHACRFVEAFDCGDKLQIIYEKASSATLFEEEGITTGKAMDESLVQVYARQICMCLSVMHRQGIVHGRLRDTSVLVAGTDLEEGEERSVKICDIGQTYILRATRCHANGTIDFEAPEILWDELDMPSSPPHMQTEIKRYMASDMWSLGILLYRMLTGKLPFSAKTREAQANDIKGSIVKFGSEWADMPEAKDAVHSLLKHSDRIRMTADKMLKSQWVSKGKENMSKSKMRRVLQNVIYNTGESTFKKFSMRVIAEEMQPDKLAIARKAFRAVDKNGDGTLDCLEIRDVLRKYGEEEGDADAIFEAIDRDASGTLNFAEFTAVSIGPHEYCDRTVLWHTFNRFDRDRSGSFDEGEIARVVREVEHLAEGAAVEKEVEEISRDINMPMDFDTFVQIMVTPTGQPINNIKCTYDSTCYAVFKVDNHKVRHIEPKSYEPGGGLTNPLMKSAYMAEEGGMRKSLSQKRL